MYIIPASFPLVAIRVSLLTMNWLVSIPFRSMHTFVTHSSVLAIFPLSYLIAPVVGLLSYSFGLLVWWRRYVNILIASLLPTVASVIIYVNYFASLSAMEMSIVTSHVVIKMLLALFAQEHIATLLVGNDKRKRKRLRKHGGEAFSETGLSPVFSAGETALAAAFK